MTIQAKKQAEEASKKAFEASKQAAGVSKNTFEDLSYVSKSTFGDLKKNAKEAAKKGLVRVDSKDRPISQQSPPHTTVATTNSQGKDFFSTISSDMNTIASSTSSMFSGISGLFGDKKKQGFQMSGQQMHQQKPQTPQKVLGLDSFPGRKGLATSIIKHSSPKHTQEEMQRMQNAERSSSNSENQAFLNDVVQHVLQGEGVGWLKFNRLKKLMEDESYRILVLSKLNKTLDRKVSPDDHIDDVCVSKQIWKGILKCLQAITFGLEQTFGNFGLGGMASVFTMMEIAHTHYWTKEINEGHELSSSMFSSTSLSPSERSPHQSPADSRKASINSDVNETQQSHSTTEMFKDMLAQKRNVLMSKLASFESDALSTASDVLPLQTSGVVQIPSISCRSTVSDTEYENKHGGARKDSKSLGGLQLPGKSSLSAGFRYTGGNLINTSSSPSPDTPRVYVFEGLLGKERSQLWDQMQFWEDAFLDVSIGIIY